MPRGYVPTTDAGKLAFGQNAVNLITPAPTDWGLTALIATTLGGHMTTYGDSLALATEPAA